MEQILNLADELGKSISEHSRFEAAKKAEAAVDADAETKKILERFEEQAKKIRELEAANKPIEPEDKKAIIEIEDEIKNSDLLQELARCQADFNELMYKINVTINQHLSLL